MAETIVDDIDPAVEYPTRAFLPKPVQPGDLDPDRVVFRFDRQSDTLLVFLYGPERQGISVSVGRWAYMLVDPVSEEIVGLHIEGFLGQAIREMPELVEILDVAELRGFTPEDVRAIQRRVLRPHRRLASWIRSFFEPSPEHRRRVASKSFKTISSIAQTPA